MLSTSILTFCLLSFATADDVVNLINPYWARPVRNGGGNIAGSYAASVVGADATVTTYAVGCKPNQTFTNTISLSFATRTDSHVCATDKIAQMTFTQGPTSMHWEISNDDSDGDVFTWTANYTFSKTLDPIVEATEFWIQGNPSGSYANTVVQASVNLIYYINEFRVHEFLQCYLVRYRNHCGAGEAGGSFGDSEYHLSGQPQIIDSSANIYKYCGVSYGDGEVDSSCRWRNGCPCVIGRGSQDPSSWKILSCL